MTTLLALVDNSNVICILLRLFTKPIILSSSLCFYKVYALLETVRGEMHPAIEMLKTNKTALMCRKTVARIYIEPRLFATKPVLNALSQPPLLHKCSELYHISGVKTRVQKVRSGMGDLKEL